MLLLEIKLGGSFLMVSEADAGVYGHDNPTQAKMFVFTEARIRSLSRAPEGVGAHLRQVEAEIDGCIQKLAVWNVKRDALLRRLMTISRDSLAFSGRITNSAKRLCNWNAPTDYGIFFASSAGQERFAPRRCNALSRRYGGQ